MRTRIKTIYLMLKGIYFHMFNQTQIESYEDISLLMFFFLFYFYVLKDLRLLPTEGEYTLNAYARNMYLYDRSVGERGMKLTNVNNSGIYKMAFRK